MDRLSPHWDGAISERHAGGSLRGAHFCSSGNYRAVILLPKLSIFDLSGSAQTLDGLRLFIYLSPRSSKKISQQ